jgi:hypothetical protein
MASLEDLEARISVLEEQMQYTRQDAAAARVLAGTADRDVSEFKQTLNAHTKVLNAVRETQIEHGQDIAGLKIDVSGLKIDVSGLKTEVADLRADMTSGFTKVNIGMEQIGRLLQQVIDKG